MQMKFVEAILSNNTTDDHCREFVSQKGLLPLLAILGLPNLPVDFPTSPSCQSVGLVCKAILVSALARATALSLASIRGLALESLAAVNMAFGHLLCYLIRPYPSKTHRSDDLFINAAVMHLATLN